jgi:predicted RNA-binding Zn ribbon-like protein
MTDFSSIKYIGGELCFDFVNTVHDRSKSDSPDYFDGGYLAMAGWAKQAGVLPGKTMAVLLARARKEPEKAAAAYKKGLQIRGNLFSVLAAIAEGRKPSTLDIAVFNRIISDTFRHKKIVASETGFGEDWETTGYQPELLFWPIIESAHRVIISGDRLKIRKCPSCHWLFSDTSKAGKRVWCSMDTCGAIDKAKRYYQRKKVGSLLNHTIKNI